MNKTIWLFAVLALCTSLAIPRLSYSHSFNGASRTSGYAPLGVFFDVVNTSEPSFQSEVIQPRGYVSNPSNCTGVHISRVNIKNNLGAGTLAFDRFDSTLSWQAPGDTAGTQVNVSSGGSYSLFSGNQNAAIFVWVNPTELPIDNTSDSIVIVNGGDRADWHSFQFSWDFGDPNAGSWDNGATLADGGAFSKNKAFGFVAGHVYEQPGLYTVSLSVIDDVGETHVYSLQITVTDAPHQGWTTYHFAADGNDVTGDGTASNPFESFDKAASLVSDRVKLLFKRGDSFLVTDDWVPSAESLYVGSYGEGDRPKLISTGVFPFVNGRNLTDARFVDVYISNNLPIEQSRRGADGFMHLGNDALLLRVGIQDIGIGISVTPPTSTATVQECEIQGALMGLWASGSPKAAVLGCSFTDGRTYSGDVEALFRVYTDKLAVSHSYFARPNQKNTIRFMSNSSNYGKYYIVSYNRLHDVYGPDVQGNDDSLMVRQMLVEGNEYHCSGSGYKATGLYGGEHLMVRNNRVLASATGSVVSLNGGYNQYDFHFSDVYVLNNMIHSTSTDYLRFLDVSYEVAAKAKNIIVQNNIMNAPNSTDTIMSFFVRLRESDASETLLESDYNGFFIPGVPDLFQDSSGQMSLSLWQSKGHDTHSLAESPHFRDPESFNFRLQENSPYIDKGVQTSHCRIDADGRMRPQGAGQDIGPYEFWKGQGDVPSPPKSLRIKNTGKKTI